MSRFLEVEYHFPCCTLVMLVLRYSSGLCSVSRFIFQEVYVKGGCVCPLEADVTQVEQCTTFIQKNWNSTAWNFGSLEAWKFGSLDARERGSAETWGLGSLEVRKLGSFQAWKLGSLEVRKLGNLQAWKLRSSESLKLPPPDKP